MNLQVILHNLLNGVYWIMDMVDKCHYLTLAWQNFLNFLIILDQVHRLDR